MKKYIINVIGIMFGIFCLLLPVLVSCKDDKCTTYENVDIVVDTLNGSYSYTDATLKDYDDYIIVIYESTSKQFETIQTTDGYKPKTTYTTTRYKNKFVGDYTYKILTTEIVSEEIQYIAG